MRVSKSVSIELEDLSKIQNRIKNGKMTFSEFVQMAIQKELENGNK